MTHYPSGKMILARERMTHDNARLPLSEHEQTDEIAKVDLGVATLARVIRHPGIAGSAVSRLIRLGERGSMPVKIDILE